MKKILGFLGLAALTLSLAACGSGDSAKKADANQLKSIQDAGVIKIATSADFAPFEFHAVTNGKDQIVGADVDLANEIAKDLGVKVEFMDMEFNAVLTALDQGKADLAISGISATKERKKTFDFSDNYFVPEQLVVVKKENADKYKDLESLADKKIGAQKGSIQESVVTSQLPNAQLVGLAKVPNLIVEVKQGSIDALVLESAVAKAYVAQNPDLVIADATLKSSDDESYAIAMKKGNKELKAKINAVIKKLQDENKINEFVEKNSALAESQAKK